MRRQVGRLALGLGFVTLGSVATPAEAHAEEWRTGDSVPTGYHVERPQTGGTIVGVGLGIFAAGYVPSAALGGLGLLVCSSWGPCSPSPGLLLIPVAGPFLLGTGEPLFVLAGIAQTGGLAVALMGGMLMSGEKPAIVPNEMQVGSVRVRLEPSVGSGAAGAVLGGTF